MAPVPAFNSALLGIQNGFSSLNRHASNIASAATLEGENKVSLTESLIGLKQSEIQVKASMEVVNTVDEVLGTLLDVQA